MFTSWTCASIKQLHPDGHEGVGCMNDQFRHVRGPRAPHWLCVDIPFDCVAPGVVLNSRLARGLSFKCNPNNTYLCVYWCRLQFPLSLSPVLLYYLFIEESCSRLPSPTSTLVDAQLYYGFQYDNHVDASPEPVSLQHVSDTQSILNYWAYWVLLGAPLQGLQGLLGAPFLN